MTVDYAYGLIRPTFDLLALAIARSEWREARPVSVPVDLSSVNDPVQYRPFDLYVSLFVSCWTAAEDLELVEPVASTRPARPSEG